MRNKKHSMIRLASAIIFLLAIAVLIITALTGCTEAERVSANVSKEADNFNVQRRLTVINCRTDKVILSMTGTFSVQHSNGDLDVIVQLPNGRYQKHFVGMNEWTTYVVEDISETNVSKYAYEIEFMPEVIPGIKITNNE
jgi:hypothetical protein